MNRTWSKRGAKPTTRIKGTKGHHYFCWQLGEFHTLPPGHPGGAEAVVASARAIDYCPLCNPDAPIPRIVPSRDGGITVEETCPSS